MNRFAADRARVLALTLAAPLALNLAYVLGVSLEHLPACVPYLSGCTTTSSTGHAWPERALFLPGMLFTAVLSIWFWRRCARVLGVAAPRLSSALPWLGLLAGVSLAGYALCIGQPGDTMRLVRRIGIDGFFLANYAAQVTLLLAAARGGLRGAGRRWLLGLCLALPAVALLGEVAQSLGAPRRAASNVVEWHAILLVCGYYAAAGHYLLSKSAGRAASPTA